MTRIAVVGAGLSGLVAARELSREHETHVFEKSRGTGGRMATRRNDRWHFDHGAQFFTARTAAFRRFIGPLEARGVIAGWNARFAEIRHGARTATRRWNGDHPHFVGVPGMSAVGRYLASGLTIDRAFHVERLEPAARGWIVVGADEERRGPFDWVVLSAPAAQTAALLPTDSTLSDVVHRRKMKACYALLLGFERELSLDFDAARILDPVISWISANHSKPGRPAAPALVVHSTNAWADAHIDDEIPAVRDALIEATAAVAGRAIRDAAHIDVHRWRFANADKSDRREPQVDAERGLAVCGDWLVRGRVEAAFTSAKRLLERFSAVT